MLNVTLVSHSPYTSGAENMLVHLAQELCLSERFNPTVLVPNAAAGALYASLARRKIPWRSSHALRWYIYETATSQRSYSRQVLKTAEEYAELYWRTNADVVVVNALVSLEPALGAYLAGLPYVLWIHGIIELPENDSFKVAMDDVLLKNATSIVCCSHWTEEYFRRLNIKNLRTIHNWTDQVPEPGSLPERSNRLCIVTTLEHHKDTETAIRAIAKLKASGVPVGLDVYGEGPLRPYLESLIRKLEVVDLVTLHGRTENPIDCYRKAMAVVVPSIVESFGLVALEAMATGTPVIASKVGGLQEIINDGESGIFFEASNPDDLALKVRAVLEHPTLRQCLAAGGRNSVTTNFLGSRAKSDFEETLQEASQRSTPYEEGGFDLVKLLAGGSDNESVLSPGVVAAAHEMEAIRASGYWRLVKYMRSIDKRVKKAKRYLSASPR